MSEQRTFKCESQEESYRLVTSDPIVCYCNKPASRTYTLEYGAVLDCANYDIPAGEDYSSGGDSVCGFHVHENSWLKIRQDLLQGKGVDPVNHELAFCPLYNFTYCTIFHQTNILSKTIPFVLPKCSCEKSVVFCINHHEHDKNRPVYHFICRNSLINGTKSCSWYFGASKVVFPRLK